MDNNFFGEIEDFLENFGSPGGNTILKDPSPPNSNNTTTTKAVLGERLKSRNGAEKRKLEDENTSMDAQGGYGEMTKNAKLDDSSDLRPEKELPRAPNRSTTLLAQALTEKRPLSNPSNNSILDPVSGALTKDDHHFYDDENNSSLNKPPRANDEIRNYIKQNPNVNRLLTQLQSNKPGPKKGSNKMDAPPNNGFHGGDGFPPPHNNVPPFDPQLSSPMDNPKDSLDFSPFDPSQQQGLMMGPNGMYNGPPNKAPSRRHINNPPCFNNGPPPQHYPPQAQHELNWDYSNNNNNNNSNKIMYNQPQPQQMRPMMMRQDLHGSRPQMNGSFPNEFGGMNPRGFNGGPNYGPPPSRGGSNMIPGGAGGNNNNMYRRMGPYGANGPPYGGGGNPLMQPQPQPQHQYSDNYNGYNVMDDGRIMGNGGDFGGGMPLQNNLPPPQRMNYGAMIPQPHGSPRMNSPGNMRYDQQHPQYDFGGNRFGNRYGDYPPQLNNPANNNSNFQQQQPRPSYRPPMPQQTTQQLPPPPPQQQQQQPNGFINGCLPGEEPLNEASEFPLMNPHPQQQTTTTTTHPHHHPQQQQQQHYTQRQQQSHHQTDMENCSSSSWKNDASEMRKGLLDNLQKALGQDTSNAAALAEKVELEAFNTSHTKESYYQRLAEWLAGIFSQQQQQQASPTQQSQDDSGSSSQTSTNSSNNANANANANSNSSSSNQKSNSIPDSTNKWFDPPGPDVSSTELLDGVLALDSSEENNSTPVGGLGNSSSNNTNGAGGNELNSDSNSNSSVASNGSSGGGGNNNNNNNNNNNSGTGGNSKSQVHPILSSLLPAPSSSSSSSTTKSVVDELFSSSHSSPSGTSVESSVVTSDSFQSPLTLSSSSASSTTNTTSSCSRRSSGKGGGGGGSGSASGGSNNSTPNSSNVVNNPHSVDSGIGSPRSITSSSLYSPKIPQGTSPSLIPNSENSPDK